MSEEIDQFHQLKEYFRQVATSSCSEWEDLTYAQQSKAHAIFIKCAGDDLIDYVNITKNIQYNIYQLLNSEAQYKENKTPEDRNKQTLLLINVSVPFIHEIVKNIHGHVMKIFYECTPSGDEL